MRLLIAIFLLFSSCAKSQLYFGRFSSSSTPPAPSSGERVLIFDDFNGTSLSSNYEVRRPDKQTISVSGGYATITGNGDYITDGGGRYDRWQSFQLNISDTAYGYSMLRNYKIELRFQILNKAANTPGCWVGTKNAWDGFSSNGFANLLYNGANDSLVISGYEDTSWWVQPLQKVRTTGMTFTVNDWCRISYIVNEGTATAKIVNETVGDSMTVVHTFTMAPAGVWPLRPNEFYYSFGVMGKTSIKVDWYRVTTTEWLNPKVIIVGNSITAGYCGGADSNYAYMLRPYTAGRLQIVAGAGNTILQTFESLTEIYATNPQYAILNLGTNSGGTVADYQRLVDSLELHGITCYVLSTVNGGNPLTSGTFNYNIKTQFGIKFIDTWTNGWNISAGTSEMSDALHPLPAGNRRQADLIRAALPSIFEL